MIVDVSRRLPDRPSLEQLRKQAKELKASSTFRALSDAQHLLAREYGFESWATLKLHVEQTTLRRVIRDGEPGRVEALLQVRGLADLSFPEGDTPLLVAAEANQPAIVELLVRYGARMNTKYARSAHNPLSWAITNGAFEAAQKLVELGAEPDLFCAAGLGDLRRVESFWVNGNLVPGASTTGSSRHTRDWQPLPRPPSDPIEMLSDALYIACRSNRLEVATFLLSKGADPDFPAYMGGTCLHWAEVSASPLLCQALRRHGASDEPQDYVYSAPPKLFPAMIFAGWGSKGRLRSLLENDPSLVRAETAFGTPLHAAADGGNPHCLSVLLSAGADKSVRNSLGRTALDLAVDKGHPACADLLR